ncbi:MAG: addiction module toxin RelE [Planctomycetes bacterium]|nr:addiction module toxin RelE [Planctomycetota bacterium]
MAKQPRFTLTFAPETIDHLDAIESKYHGVIRRLIKEQLCFTPVQETRNRKTLDQPAPFDAGWELRGGPGNRFRVFYDVDLASRTVFILAIGIKERDRLMVGGEEYTT